MEVFEGVAPVRPEFDAQRAVNPRHRMNGAVERDGEAGVGQQARDLLRLAYAVAEHDRLAPGPERAPSTRSTSWAATDFQGGNRNNGWP